MKRLNLRQLEAFRALMLGKTVMCPCAVRPVLASVSGMDSATIVLDRIYGLDNLLVGKNS